MALGTCALFPLINISWGLTFTGVSFVWSDGFNIPPLFASCQQGSDLSHDLELCLIDRLNADPWLQVEIIQAEYETKHCLL